MNQDVVAVELDQQVIDFFNQIEVDLTEQIKQYLKNEKFNTMKRLSYIQKEDLLEAGITTKGEIRAILGRLGATSASTHTRRSFDMRTKIRKEFEACTNFNSLDDINKAIDKLIEEPNTRLNALLENNELPGEVYWYASKTSFKEKLLIADLGDGSKSPNFLIHELCQARQEVMEHRKEKVNGLHQELMCGKVSVMIGPSGCGKTRTILEYLSMNFGLFLTASTKANGGSGDFELLLRTVRSSDDTEAALIRSVKLYYGFQSIVAIRLLFLQRLKNKYQSKITSYHWLMMQLMPCELFGSDVFKYLYMNYKMNVNDLKKPENRMVVFVDESQILMYDKAEGASMNCCSGGSMSFLVDLFAFDKDHENDDHVSNIACNRKPTSPILNAFTKLSAKNLTFVVAGTGLQFDEFKEWLDSMVAKSKLMEATYIKLGNFLFLEKFKSYVAHYLPELSPSQLEYIHSYVKGRYRFTVSFISFYLEFRHEKHLQVEESINKAIESLYKIVISNIQPRIAEQYRNESILVKYPKLLSIMCNYFSSGMSFNMYKKKHSVDNKVDDAWLIETGLGLISDQNTGNDLEFFTNYPSVLDNVQILEPVIFDVLNGLLVPTNKCIKTQYIDESLDRFVLSPKQDSSPLGFIVEPVVALQFVKLIEDGQLPVLKNE